MKGDDALLIVYYAGHGVKNPKNFGLELAGYVSLARSAYILIIREGEIQAMVLPADD